MSFTTSFLKLNRCVSLLRSLWKNRWCKSQLPLVDSHYITSHAEQLETRLALTGAQDNPSLLVDINVESSNSDPMFTSWNTVTKIGSYSFFTASDEQHGHELWRTDGTTLGTELVADTFPGPSSSEPRSLTVSGDKLFYIATTEAGTHLFVTDGSTSGTVQLTTESQSQLYPQPQFAYLAAVNDGVVFQGFSAANGIELWFSGGTPATTGLLKDLNTLPGSSNSYPRDFVAFAGQIYFSAAYGDNANMYIRGDSELWRTDGTLAGTVLIDTASTYHQSLTPAGNTLFFTGDSFDIWKSDGTAQGTQLVRNIRPAYPYQESLTLTPVGDMVFFPADDGEHGRELWKSDGTEAGTVLVKDIRPGSSMPYYPGGISWKYGSSPRGFTASGDTLFFVANSSGGSESQLWVSDGTTQGTVAVTSFESDTEGGSASYASMPALTVPFLTPSETGVFFRAEQGDLWHSDGTLSGTGVIKDFVDEFEQASSSSYASMAMLNGELLFSAKDSSHGVELWSSDGTESGTQLVKDIASGTKSAFQSTGDQSSSAVHASSALLNGSLIFGLDDGVHGTELWRTDGTESGTSMLKDISLPQWGSPDSWSSFPEQFTAAQDRGFVFFVTEKTWGGDELWVTDGTTQGTRLLFEGPTFDFEVANTTFSKLTTNGSKLFFQTTSTEYNGTQHSKLWQADYYGAGVTQGGVTELYGTEGFSGDSLIAIDELPFYVSNGELWQIYPGMGPSRVAGFNSPPSITSIVAAGDLIFGYGERFCFFYDPMTYTKMTYDMWDVAMESYTGIASVGESAFLTSNSQLFHTNGGAPVDITPISGMTFEPLRQGQTVEDDRLFFRAKSPGMSDWSVWETRGTKESTIQSVLPLANQQITSFLGKVGAGDIFVGEDASHGRELWIKQPDNEAPTAINLSGIIPTLADGHDTSVGIKVATVSVTDDGLGTNELVLTGPDAEKFELVASGLYLKSNVSLDRATQSRYDVSIEVNDPTVGEEIDASTSYSLVVAPAVGGTGPHLVSDINHNGQSSHIHKMVTAGTKTFFFANDITHGSELWVTDGTTEGTSLVKDIQAGPLGSALSVYGGTRLIPSGEHVFFLVGGGKEIWKSDGTPAGTVLMHTLSSAYPQSELIAFGDYLVFTSSISENEMSIHRMHTHTGLVSTIHSIDRNYGIANLTVAGDTLYWSEQGAPEPEQSGILAWKENFQTAVNVMPQDGGGGYYDLRNMTAVDDTLFFVNSSSDSQGVYQIALWKTDGTQAGTRQVLQLNDYFAGEFATVGQQLFVLGSNELWRTDGTESGTQLIYDGLPSWSSSLTALDNEVFFIVQPDAINTRHNQLWVSDGTNLGTTLLVDLPDSVNASETKFQKVDDELFFRAGKGDLWKTDGTLEGTVEVRDFEDQGTYVQYGSGSFASLATLGGSLLFSANADGTGQELWTSDGTEAGTTILKDIAAGSADAFPDLELAPWWSEGGYAFSNSLLPSSYPSGTPGTTPPAITTPSGVTYFSANDGHRGMELWRTDGTAVGTKLVKDLASERWLGVRSATGSYPKDFMQINEQVYFVAQGPEGGPAWSLWKVDGDTVHEVQTLPFTSNGDVPHQDVTFSVTDAPAGFFQFLVQNGSVALLYQSDGTSEGTTVINEFTAMNGQLFGYFILDGLLSRDIGPTSLGSMPTSILDIAEYSAASKHQISDNFSYFSVNDSNSQRHWFFTDGTPVGTRRLDSLLSNLEIDSTAGNLRDGLFYFRGRLSGGQWQLWSTDGTEAGTKPLSVEIDDPALILGRNTHGLLLNQRDAVFGGELWLSPVPAAAIALSSTTQSIPENTATTQPTRVGTIHIFGNGVENNSINVVGPDAQHFEVIGNELRLKAGVTLDYESQSSYSVSLQLQSVGSTQLEEYNLAVTDIDEYATIENRGNVTLTLLQGSGLYANGLPVEYVTQSTLGSSRVHITDVFGNWEVLEAEVADPSAPARGTMFAKSAAGFLYRVAATVTSTSWEFEGFHSIGNAASIPLYKPDQIPLSENYHFPVEANGSLMLRQNLAGELYADDVPVMRDLTNVQRREQIDGIVYTAISAELDNDILRVLFVNHTAYKEWRFQRNGEAWLFASDHNITPAEAESVFSLIPAIGGG